MFDRFFDVPSKNELVTHLLHCSPYSSPNYRLAQALDRYLQCLYHPFCLRIFENLACEHERPGRRVDKRRA